MEMKRFNYSLMLKRLAVAVLISLNVNSVQADEVTSHRELVDSIKSATGDSLVNLTADIITENMTIDGVQPGRDVTIDGNGHSFTGANNMRLFNVDGVYGTKHSLTLQNFGSVDSDGNPIAGINGATYNANTSVVALNYGGKLNIKNSVIYGNTSSFYGGVLMFDNGATSDIIDGTFVNNKVIHGGHGGVIFISDGSFIEKMTGTYKENSADSYGGVICNLDSTIENLSGKFINNSSNAGGAIFNQGKINIVADETDTEFTGNYDQTFGSNSIYNASSLNVNAGKDRKIVFNDGIVNIGNIDINNPAIKSNLTTGTVEINNSIKGESEASINLYNGCLKFGNNTQASDYYEGNIDNTTFTVNGGIVDLQNKNIQNTNLGHLVLNTDMNYNVDGKWDSQIIDTITADSFTSNGNNIVINNINIIEPTTRMKVDFQALGKGMDSSVRTAMSEAIQYTGGSVAMSPIYKYKYIGYNKDTAVLSFARFDASENPGEIPVGPSGGNNNGSISNNFNPAVLSAPVSSVAASQATINETFKYVFEHADTFSKLPLTQRMVMMNSNKYALSTDFNENIPVDNLHNKAGWFRPYVTFETMHLKNGPKVHATTYGSLAGFDTDFKEHKHGWHSVGTGYVGYNGSQLNYKGVDTTMNGGLLGYTHTMYKGNFWNALTLSAGASVGTSNTMYGKEDFTSLLAGVGSKTGYNFEFKEGKYILQPIMFMSYTFVNTFDYTNAAGVKVKPSPAHSIQLNPSVRFIANTKNGWQPYASVGMVWNVMNENKVTANNVRLPEMGMKPYVEYGVGLQRNWKDKFTAFGQAMLRNGGRNGIALTAGFRWALGKEGKPIEKVQGVTNKISKSLEDTQS